MWSQIFVLFWLKLVTFSGYRQLCESNPPGHYGGNLQWEVQNSDLSAPICIYQFSCKKAYFHECIEQNIGLAQQYLVYTSQFSHHLLFNYLIYWKTCIYIKILINSSQVSKINKRTVRNKIIQVGKNTKN